MQHLQWLLQPLLTQLNAGVLVLDKHNKVVFFNHFIASRANVELVKVQGKLLEEVFSDLPLAWLQRKLASVLATGQTTHINWEQRQFVLKLPHLGHLNVESQYMAQNCTIFPLMSPEGERFVCLLIEDATDSFVYSQKLQQRVNQLEQANRIDCLTGVFNRPNWQTQLGYEIQRSERYKHPLSVLLFDLDRFKALNDKYGHQAGDAVLVEITRVIGYLLRDTDILGRYGGEEFGIILPDTNLMGAIQVANRICETVANHKMRFNHEMISVTVSIGVALYTRQEADELIQQADMALYSAKRQGKNRAVAYDVTLEGYLKKTN